MFTNDQLKVLSSEILLIPKDIQTQQDNKVFILAEKDAWLKKDDVDKVFYDGFKANLKSYFDEISLLNGTVYTQYSDSDLDNSARLSPGNPHFPQTPIWINLPPKLISSMNGLPTSSVSSHESLSISNTIGSVASLKNGFSDGSTTGSLFDDYTGGSTIKSDVAFTPGHRIVVIGTGGSLMATVNSSTLVNLPTPHYDLAVSLSVSPSGTILTGATIQDFFPGFTNTERESGVTTSPELMASLELALDNSVADLVSKVDAEMVVLNASTVGGLEATEVQNAKNSINDLKAIIQTWESRPLTGIGTGKYGDNSLNDLESGLTSRSSYIPTRISQITGFLGSVSQDAQGSFSGSGHFKSLTTWIEQRCHLVFGTLRSYYDADLKLLAVNQAIIGLTNKKAEYDLIAIVKQITEDTVGDTVKLTDSSSLSLGDSVKIMDDQNLTVADATILNISGQDVQLSMAVPGYLANKIARLVKLL